MRFYASQAKATSDADCNVLRVKMKIKISNRITLRNVLQIPDLRYSGLLKFGCDSESVEGAEFKYATATIPNKNSNQITSFRLTGGS